MTDIIVYNVAHREDAEPLIRALAGKSYMKLEVGLVPVGGSFDVMVSTCRPDTSEEELRDMVMFMMSSLVMDMGHPAVRRTLEKGAEVLGKKGNDYSSRAAASVSLRAMQEHYGEDRAND